MRVGICYDAMEDYGFKTVNFDSCNRPTKKTIYTIAEIVESQRHDICLVGGIRGFLDSFEKYQCDLFFPIYGGSLGTGKQTWFPTTLELLNLPFIGTNAMGVLLACNKYHTKLIASANNIPTIPSVLFREDIELHSTPSIPFDFPCVVKPNFESHSRGVFLAHSMADLNKKVSKLLKEYHQPILCEPFLSGSEITVSLYEQDGVPKVFGMAEIVGMDGNTLEIYSYENKHLQKCPKIIPRISSVTNDIIKLYAIKAFKEFGCHDYCRVDFRLDDQGNPYLLEVTPIPSLPLSASFFTAGRLYNNSPEVVIGNIISSAKKRFNLVRKG
ncbi:ATP-grasp domain-containing protein [Ihubacter massiliensis]|uniref:ATP-grasp domain-containing protein n=1 Tax=Hominibacterium faecale TaxID=2839743 RepID=A0A9J6QU09_9FIRM|nr:MULTISPECIES: ATP-grasp domain-containing protein [Eubacteriales Family XIII. Incertae Sedis]MCO7124078.1 ATP-grasp domain-containing protein [Ihubacter massiliensis]MCU7379068.1 ATP-grasp domain-containing protein [Hominibacterium faecale]